MGTFFCPYLGRDVDDAEGSDEHVVPESLGGSRDLLIRVESKTNSDLGSSVDAEANKAYSNRRVQHDLRGKSGSEPKLSLRVSLDDFDGLAARWEMTTSSNAIRVTPEIEKVWRPDGGLELAVYGTSDETARIRAEIRKSHEAKGVTVHDIKTEEFTVENPKVTRHLDFDELLLERFFAKVALGFCHWRWGEEWSRGDGADALRQALWSKSADEIANVQIPRTTMLPASLPLRLGENEHAFLTAPLSGGHVALCMFFFGQMGMVMSLGCPRSVRERVEPWLTLVEVTERSVRSFALEDLPLDRRTVA